MTQKSKSRNVLASPLGEEGHEVAKGVQANWIHRGAPRPANPERRHPAKSVWTVVRMIMILDVDVTAERRHYNTHCRLKGKRLTTFCASLRSGGRRLAVRTAMEHPIGTQPRTPFPASRDFPSRGNEKIGGTGYCVTYDTDSQSRNADFISIARRAIRHLQRRRRCRPLSEANTTRRRQAATTLGAKPRQPSPLNPLNLLNPLNPHAAGVSKSYCFFSFIMLECAGTKSPENAIGNFYARKFL